MARCTSGGLRRPRYTACRRSLAAITWPLVLTAACDSSLHHIKAALGEEHHQHHAHQAPLLTPATDRMTRSHQVHAPLADMLQPNAAHSVPGDASH
jgi:hypothetical protein